ncbi:mitochondrial coenzyme A diphosphatase NUDT8-like [Galleria mellonella]|uniref:Mitochondrial coenzyme A diphosphatase NUDT8-like n=1 Tax=Galleria mellonella TaxID=7137 RepID=A0ABM3MUY4_GALME|nr:mitochondrial coenzyme A diphosphatase NUDT8-like [Galleria mellonella]
MFFTPQTLLSNVARERCLSNIKELPSFFRVKEQKPNVFASVLVPLCINKNEVCLLYTLRSSKLNSHSGQVSFPGGKLDNNETVYEAALRETEEEIGVNRSDVDIWAKMPQVQGRGSILVTPVVGLIKNFEYNNLRPNIDEVDEVFTVPISALCNRNSHGRLEFENMFLPVYLYEKYKIWGITGLITHLFLQSLLPETVYDFHFDNKKFSFDELMPSKL